MRYPIPRIAGIVVSFFSISASFSQAQNLSPLGSYSVITSGDFSTTSDVEGSTIVGGNLNGSNSANFAIHLQGAAPADQKTLRVAGSIAAGNPINLNAGSLELGGSLNGRIINYNGGGSLIANPGLDFSSVFAQLDEASATLADYQANSTAAIPSGQPGPYLITANPDSEGLAVLLLDGASLFGNYLVQQIDLAVNGASEILINLSGTSMDWNSGNFVGAFTDTVLRRNIVWNFYEATTINLGARNMMGQVLAPHAHVTSQGNIDGSIYAKSLNTNGEVHLPGYGGRFTCQVPEPGSLLLGALGALMILRRRRTA